MGKMLKQLERLLLLINTASYNDIRIQQTVDVNARQITLTFLYEDCIWLTCTETYSQSVAERDLAIGILQPQVEPDYEVQVTYQTENLELKEFSNEGLYLVAQNMWSHVQRQDMQEQIYQLTETHPDKVWHQDLIRIFMKLSEVDPDLKVYFEAGKISKLYYCTRVVAEFDEEGHVQCYDSLEGCPPRIVISLCGMIQRIQIMNEQATIWGKITHQWKKLRKKWSLSFGESSQTNA